MSKINKNLILNSLVIIGISVFGMTIPLKVDAATNYGGNDSYFNGGYNNYNYMGTTNQTPVIYMLNPGSINRGSGPLVVAITGSYFAPGAIAQLNGSDRTTTYINSSYLQMHLNNSDTNGLGDYLITVYNPTPGGGFSNTATFKINGTQVNGPLPVTPSAPTVVKTSSSPTVAKAPAKKESTKSADLTANVLSSSFLPSNIIQWLIFLILTLSAIVLWRKIYVSNKDKVKPLKYE